MTECPFNLNGRRLNLGEGGEGEGAL